VSTGQERPPIWWVRFKEGTAGLTQRVTHAVPIPVGFPDVLTAYCGQVFRQGEGNTEIVESLTGQPCNGCLLNLPLPPEPLQLSGAEPRQLHDDG
jgi:hypothetical protein